MQPVIDIQTKSKRRGESSMAAEARNALAIAELPEMFKTFGKQNAAVHRAIKEQTAILQNQLTIQVNQRDWTERLHERMDAIAIESRVTNVLLAQLVAIHKSVVVENIDSRQEDIRSDAYHRVLNGE